MTLIHTLADLLRIVASASPTPCVHGRACEPHVCVSMYVYDSVCVQRASMCARVCECLCVCACVCKLCVVCMSVNARRARAAAAHPCARPGVVVEVVCSAVGCAPSVDGAAGEGVGVKDALRVHRGPLREGRTRFHVSPPALSRSLSFRLRRSRPHAATTVSARVITRPTPRYHTRPPPRRIVVVVVVVVVDDVDHSVTSKLFRIFSVREEDNDEEERREKKGFERIFVFA